MATSRKPAPMSVVSRTLEVAASVLVVVAIWEFIIRYFEVPPYLFPKPSDVGIALWNGLISGEYFKALGVTLGEILLGFLTGSAIGVAIGMMVIIFPIFDRLVYPFIVAIQTV